MLRYATLQKKPRDLLALTGLARREFEELLPVFEQALPKLAKRRKRRQRAPGGGRKPSLPTVADKLLFVLVYTKTYPIQSVQAHLFGMSQSSANRYLRQLLPVLAEALDRLGVTPERDGSKVAQHEQRSGEPHDLIVDGVERRRQRPKDSKIQAIHYSGKKKVHCDKNVVVVNTQTKRVSFLSPTLPGVVHDKTLAEHVAIRYPRRSTLRSDLGFLGYAPRVQEHLQPKKAQDARVEPAREARQPQTGPGAGARRACHRGHQDLPHHERRVPQSGGRDVRYGDEHRNQPAQFSSCAKALSTQEH